MEQISNISPTDVETLTSAVLKLAENSEAQFGIGDVILLVGAEIVGVAILVFIIWKFILGGKGFGRNAHVKDVQKANEAHGVIVRKDPETGAYVMLTIPKLLAEFTVVAKEMKDEMKKWAKHTERLANHNGDKLDELLRQRKEQSK